MTEAEKEAREALIDDREALANLIPLGFTERDPVRSVYEAADRIIAAGFRRGAPAEPAVQGDVKLPQNSEPTEAVHIVPCARCGVRKVVAADAVNSNIEVCGHCGVEIGLYELGAREVTDEMEALAHHAMFDGLYRCALCRKPISMRRIDENREEWMHDE